jgi:hypothetical protein
MRAYVRRSLAVVAALFVAAAASGHVASGTVFYGNDSMPCSETRSSNPSPTYTLYCYNTGLSIGYTLIYNDWAASNDGAFSSGGGLHQNQWNAASSTGTAVMQTDGNFVFYTNSSLSTAAWSTSTYGNSGAFLNLQDDGNLVVYNSSNVPIWAIH